MVDFSGIKKEKDYGNNQKIIGVGSRWRSQHFKKLSAKIFIYILLMFYKNVLWLHHSSTVNELFG